MNTTFSYRIHSRMLQLYETINAWRACYGRAPRLSELARACGLKEWQTYAALIGLRWRELVRGSGGRRGR